MPAFSVKNLEQLMDANPQLGEALKGIQTYIRNLESAAGTSGGGPIPAPPQINQVTAVGGTNQIAVSIVDQSAATAVVSQGINYHVEYSTDPNFPKNKTWAADFGAARDGVIPVGSGTYHVRAFSQYPNSLQSDKVAFGNNTPTPVVVAGTALVQPAPQGSGSGANGGFGNGQDATSTGPIGTP